MWRICAHINRHQGDVGVGEAVDDAGAAPDFPVQPLNHVVREDTPPVPGKRPPNR